MRFGVRQLACVLAAYLLSPLAAALVEPPAIVQQPAVPQVLENEQVVLSVTATGEGLSYQWRLNGVNLPGANQPILTLPNFTIPNGGRYDVIVWNEGGAVISTPAGVTITLAGLPVVDLFANRVVPPLPSPPVGRGAGNNFAATRDTNEPRHAGKPGGRSVWYSWLAPASGIVKFSTAGSDFDTVLAAYTGTSLPNLAATQVAADDDSGGHHTSELMFNAQAGTIYYIAIDSHNGQGGNFVLSWNLEIPLDIGDRLPVITRKPTSVVELQGRSAKLSIDYLSTGTEQVQWFFKGEPIAGSPFELLIAELQPQNVGPYQVQLRKGNRVIRTEPVDVQINLKDNATLKNIFAYNKFAETFFVEKQNGTLAASGFTILSAGTSRGYSGTQVFSTYGATTDPEEPLICGFPGGASEWYAYKAEQTGLLKVDTDGSNFDTVLGVYVDAGTGAGFYESLQQVACDDGSGVDGQDSMVLFAATKGTTYYIAVDGKAGASGTVTLHYYLGLPPTFLVQPTNQTAVIGGTAEFNCEIEGSGPLSYQWRFGRFNIPDAISPYYARTNVDISHSGAYVMTVWNPVGTNRSDAAMLTVTGAPVISEIADVTVAEDSGQASVGFSVTDADTNPALVMLEVTAATAALFSELVIGGSDGARTLLFTPASNASGTSVVTINAFDGTSRVSRSFQVAVTAINDPPSAGGQTLQLDEDNVLPVILSGADPDNEVLTFQIINPPTKGTLTGAPPNLVYTPNPNENGSDSFSFRTTDGTLESAPATISLSIIPLNDAPIANDQVVNVEEDLPRIVVLNGSDVEGGALAFSVLTPPTKGTLSGTPPNLTYSPNQNANGSDSFTFRTSDGSLHSSPATISLAITPINDVPIASPQSVTLNEDSSKTILLAGTDAEGTALTFSILTQPGKGTLTGTAPNLTYIPNTNANGSDSFTFSVSDGTLDSAPATVSIAIAPVNDTPVAQTRSFTVAEDGLKTILLGGTDPEGAPLTFTIITPPSKGTLTGTLPTVTYRPHANVTGSDTFSFKVTDGQAESAPANVNVTITAVNDPPVANNRSFAVGEDSFKTILLTGSDQEGSPLTFRIISQPSQGMLTGTLPTVTYTPSANVTGNDSFTFCVNDGLIDSAPAKVNISINPVNDAPVANGGAYTTQEDLSTSVILTGSDVEGSPLVYSIVSPPGKGVLTGIPPSLVYIPHKDQHGADSFSFVTSDGTLSSPPAVISVLIVAVNDVPAADNAFISVTEDGSAAIMLTGRDVEGAPISFEIMSNPTSGILTGTPPNMTYTPLANVNGSDSFTFRVSDGELSSTSGKISIEILAENDPPSAFSQSVTGDEDTAVPVRLGGADLEGSTLTFRISSSPLHGELTGTAPDLVYLPDSDFHGNDSFTFEVSDGERDSGPATVSVTIRAKNDAPVAQAQTVETAEESAVQIRLEGGDVDGDSLSFSVISPPTRGTLSGTIPDLIYTPNPNATGTDSFRFLVNDGQVDSQPQTVLIQIAPQNDPPVAANLTVTVTEDSSAAIVLSGTDVEGAPLNFNIHSLPGKGVITGVPPNLIYTPNTNLTGSDVFYYRVNDGELSAVGEVSITIVAVNDAPLAQKRTISTLEDTPRKFVLGGSDVEGSTLTYRVISQPLNGTLTGTAPNLTYTPAINFNGSDSFQFVAADGETDSAPATLTILVNGANDPPGAFSQTVVLLEDGFAEVTLTGSDIEQSPLTFSIKSMPTRGALSGTPPRLVYTPFANAHGRDSFTFSVNDGELESSAASVTFEVTAQNDAPLADPQTITLAEDSSTSITISGSDLEGAALTYHISSPPQNGTLTGTPPALVYQPNPNFFGADKFLFTVADGELESAVAEVAITVTPQTDVPLANGQSVAVAEDSSVAITLDGADIDGAPLTYLIEAQPSSGSLTGTPPNVTYSPKPNYYGSDSFSFRVSNRAFESAAAIVTIHVTPVNDNPVAENQEVSVREDTPKEIVLTGKDLEMAALSYQLVTAPRNGTLSGTPPNLVYLPPPNYSGPDAFVFKVDDGQLHSELASVSITVGPVNDAPSAEPQELQLAEDASIEVTLQGSDMEGTVLNYLVTRQPTLGSLSGTPPALVYRPFANKNGSDSFAFVVSDGERQSEPAEVLLSINEVNDPPVSYDKQMTMIEDGGLFVTLTGSDPDEDVLNFSVLSQPAKGTITGTPPNLFYKPFKHATGADTFTFATRDESSQSAAATVTITIMAQNDPPTANPLLVTAAEDNPKQILLTGRDVEGSSLTFILVSSPANGSLSGVAPTLTYIPAPNFFGNDRFTFKVSDGVLESAVATVDIAVSPINDKPLAIGQNLVTPEDTASDVTLTGTDPEGSALNFVLTTQPVKGTLSGTPPNLRYHPHPNVHGSDSFMFRATDGEVLSSQGTIRITITPINDPPVAASQAVTLLEDSPAELTLAAVDVESSPLTYTIVSGPTRGLLSGTPPNLVYQPAVDESGTDSFTYKANDGASDSAIATVSLTITAVNDQPVAERQQVTLLEDSFAEIQLRGQDAEGSPLFYKISGLPAKGQLTGELPRLIYTPDANASGADSFSFTVSDGVSTSTATEIALNIVPVNDPPVAKSLTLAGREDSNLPIILGAEDIDSEGLTYRIVTWPTLGTLTGQAPNLIYTPPPEGTGPDRMEFIVSDGSVDSSAASVDILIMAENDPPHGIASIISARLHEEVPVQLQGHDPDNGSLTFEVVTQPLCGVLTGTPPNLLYTRMVNSQAPDYLEFVVSDGELRSAPVRITVEYVAATTIVIQTIGNDALDILVNGPSGAEYLLECSSDLINWEAVREEPLTSGARVSESIQRNEPGKFFRVRAR